MGTKPTELQLEDLQADTLAEAKAFALETWGYDDVVKGHYDRETRHQYWSVFVDVDAECRTAAAREARR